MKDVCAGGDGFQTNEPDNMFHKLPDELIRHVFSFFDIPSLGKMAQIQKEGGMLSNLASCESTWVDLVNRRFRITTGRSKKYGGKTWKDAYRSMSYCNRAPKSRHTAAQKIVFAKGGGGKAHRSGCDAVVSTWVMLNHTENCQTRGRGREHRHIELYVCLQNVKSCAGSVTVNLFGSQLKLLDNHNDGKGRLIDFPRIVHLRKNGVAWGDLDDIDSTHGLVLDPFDFCVVAMKFSCGSDLYETDVLARARSLYVPVSTLTGAKAIFVPESDVWQYYMELPGGFLSLTDRNRLISV